jgi:hypothetical protein
MWRRFRREVVVLMAAVTIDEIDGLKRQLPQAFGELFERVV